MIIVSRPCDIDEPERSTLPDCSLETIRETVRAWASQTRDELRDRSERTLALMRWKYRPAQYARSIRSALAATLGTAVSGAPAR